MQGKKSNIDKIIEILQSKDESGLELLRIMQLYLLDQNEEDESSIMISNIPNSRIYENGFHAIGTWHPIQVGDEIVFKRKEQADTVFWESTRDYIYLNKKNSDKRVCIIGESAAAGMFFTPYITPSKALYNYLKTDKKNNWEVVDLTRNCMNAGALIETCKYTLQLQPDYIIIIAGNNWFSDIMIEHNGPLSRRRNYAISLEKDGLLGMFQIYKSKAEKLAKTVMSQINKMASESQTKFVFAIPALNYSSWERRVPVHWMNNGKTMEWYEYYNSALEALNDNDFKRALVFGKKMFDIDNGKNSTSNRILANCYIALGDEKSAYEHSKMECDNSLYFDEITSFPAVPSFIRREYGKGNAACPHIKFMDFEKILGDYYGSKVLGEEVFVDYCHLNPEGFHVVMAPIAHLLLSDENNKKDEWIKLAQNTPLSSVSSKALAVSYFCAALYNTHLNRPISDDFDISKYSRLFQKAIEYDKSIIELMMLYIKGRSCEKGLGFTLSKAGQKFLKLMNSPLDFPVAQEALGVDRITIQSICETLKNNSCNIQKIVEDYQYPYVESLKDGSDLTEPAYVEWINSYIKMSMDSENGTRRRLPFYKSWWPCSHFSLIADGEHELAVELTCRIPIDNAIIDKREINIIINNQCVNSIMADTTWHKYYFRIPAHMIKKGFNRVSIKWPISRQNEEIKIQELTKKYWKGIKVDFFPILGEIQSFIVKSM